MDKKDLANAVVDALKANGGRASILAVAKHIWTNHKQNLEASGDLFFTWQYDMRWAANLLRRRGIMKAVDDSLPHAWELK